MTDTDSESTNCSLDILAFYLKSTYAKWENRIYIQKKKSNLHRIMFSSPVKRLVYLIASLDRRLVSPRSDACS